MSDLGKREPEQTLILHEERSERVVLEGEVMPDAAAQFDQTTRRMTKPLDTLWWLSLLMTLWLVWLTLKGDPTGIINMLLALLLALPFIVLSAARLGLAGLLGLLRDGVQQAHAMPRNAQEWQASLRTAREQARQAKAGDWVGAAWKTSETVGAARDTLQLLMLSPAFMLALVLALLATLIMIPVTLFTLLLAVF